MEERAIVDFKVEHLEQIDARTIDGIQYNKERIEIIATRFPTYTLIIKGKIIAICGIVPIWEGVAELWTVTSTLVDKYRLSFHKATVAVLRDFTQYFKLHRIQANCLTEHTVSQKWLQRLGFKNEGLMKKYDIHKRDYFLFAKVI